MSKAKPQVDKRSVSVDGVQGAGRVGLRSTGRRMLLVASVCGLIFGIGCNGIYWRWFLRDAEHEQLQENGTLLAQQLDELFRAIESKVLVDPSSLSHYESLLRVFYIYDSQFVEANQDHDVATAEVAYAAQRAAQCALLLGDLPLARDQYLTMKKQLKKLMASQPDSRGLVWHDLIDAQSHIAILQYQRGQRDLSRNELFEIVQSLNSPSFPQDLSTAEWLSPLLPSLAALSLELGDCEFATGLATRYRDVSLQLARDKPDQFRWQEQVLEAGKLKQQIGSRCETLN